ncbi:MAG TPA: metallophosphoesterase family protein [Candidatus Nanoarchaeia archaeon]|nr:metallophosphoesterase family protein [Candidatus Nanoarchaeia archaeon]
MDLQRTIEESKDAQASDIIRLIEETIQSIAHEHGTIGNLTINGKLVTLAPVGHALIIGDLHGNLESFSAIFESSQYLTKLVQDKNRTVVFLGDYGDRGAQSPELYYCLMHMKLAFPKQIVLLRGNHEGPSNLLPFPHDLPLHLQQKFKDQWASTYAKLRCLFDCLYNAVYVEERYLMLHGGLPATLRSLQEIAQAGKLHPNSPFLEEILWNDPDEQVEGAAPSPRGAGNLFGKTTTQKILDNLNAKILIRGHEVAYEGFKINHGGKILTLTSFKGLPYFNKSGAYLDLPLTDKFEKAQQLIPYLHKI